ncbi:MAG TPA: DUF1109 domain-containing protein [Caulobacteraceae bacterium]|nr:DUF1109 domain-containing protein [Caulobacteraceae bacterium]
MRTDELIDALTADLSPAPARRVPQLLAAAAAGGAVVALGLVAAWLGFRPDLATALASKLFWMKAAYAAAGGGAGYLALERLARPAGSGRLGFGLAAVAALALVALGVAQLASAAPGARLALWLGGSWRQCPAYILALAAPMLVLVLLATRRLAPTRLVSAGAAAGLLCGGVAATVYGLHCGETAPAFVATWYSLGMALSTAVGGFAGAWALRWR